MGDDKNCPSSPLRSLRLGESFLMRHSFKVMHDELYTVKVRISPEWARWAGEKIWHESQKATNGSLEITFRLAGLDEIKRWVLSFGPEPFSWSQKSLKKWFVRIYPGIWLSIRRAPSL